MEELLDKMKESLATTFAFYLKTHYYHWNVVGSDFYEFHDFFGDIYEDVWNSVDKYAEQIRALDSFAPGSLGRFSELSIIEDETTIPASRVMIDRINQDNDKLLALILETRNMADEAQEFGLVNFLEERLDYHRKLRWMFKSFMVVQKA